MISVLFMILSVIVPIFDPPTNAQNQRRIQRKCERGQICTQLPKTKIIVRIDK